MYDVYGPGALLENETRLYDLASDPGQQHKLDDPAGERRLADLMRRLMRENDAPAEALARVDLGGA